MAKSLIKLRLIDKQKLNRCAISDIGPESKIAIVIREESVVDLIKRVLIKMGINNIVSFRTASEAFEVISRQQVDFLIVGIELDDGPGITLLQRLKATGNYGFEPFLFMGDSIDGRLLALLIEYDVEYVLTKPLNAQRIQEKITFVMEKERNIAGELQTYRDAKSAFQTSCYEMAEDMALEVKKTGLFLDKVDTLLGDVKTVEKKYDEAIDLYNQVRCRKGNLLVAATHRLAKVYMLQNEFEKAKEILDTMVEKNPEHIKILENAGLSNYRLGHCDLAEKQMDQLTSLDDSNRVAGEVATNIKIDRGDFDGVAVRMKKSHSEQEVLSRLNQAGVALSKENDFAGAIKIYKECLEIVVKKEFKGKIHFNLAIAFNKLDKTQQGIAAAKEAIKFSPDLTKAHDLLGRLLKKVS